MINMSKNQWKIWRTENRDKLTKFLYKPICQRLTELTLVETKWAREWSPEIHSVNISNTLISRCSYIWPSSSYIWPSLFDKENNRTKWLSYRIMFLTHTKPAVGLGDSPGWLFPWLNNAAYFMSLPSQ